MVMRAPQTAARKGIDSDCTWAARFFLKKERKKTDTPKEGWEDGTPPPHRGFKERSVVLAVAP